MKKFYFLTLILMIFAAMFAGSEYAQTATQPSAGDGTSGNPWQIATLDNLYWITQHSEYWSGTNSNFIQTADIDASSTSGWNAGAGFPPIAHALTFSGKYDGGGHTITGLYISQSSGSQVGMFASTNNGATIENIGLIDVNITGSSDVGGLAGDIYYSTVSNCFCTGSVTGKYHVGGLAGRLADNSGNRSTMSSSYSTATVNASSGEWVGGLVGYDNISPISECYSTGNVDGGGAYWVGGFVGQNVSATLSNCYSTGNVNASGAVYVGGFIGENDYNAVTNCYSTGTVSGSSFVGGLIGFNYNCSANNSFWDTTTSGQSSSSAGTGKTDVEMKTYSTFLGAGWDPSIWYIGDGINNGYPYLAWQNPGGSPLPVELITFTTANLGDKVELQWKTATEVNNYGFEIQRSNPPLLFPSPEGTEGWVKVGFVKGSGNSNSPKNYSYIDTNPVSGSVQYRLKQIDNDGSYKYSQIVEASFMKPANFKLSQNYPNPFNPTTMIRFALPSRSNVKIEVYNTLGEKIKELVNEQKNSGNYEVSFNTTGLASGVYFYMIDAKSIDGKNEFRDTKKMVLLK